MHLLETIKYLEFSYIQILTKLQKPVERYFEHSFKRINSEQGRVPV